MSKTAEGHITPTGNICCPACGCKGAEAVPGGVELRCQRCKLEYQIQAALWEARTDFAIVDGLSQLIHTFQRFLEHREERLGKRLVMA